MLKKAEEYTPEELLSRCQNYAAGLFWMWYRAARDIVGEKKAEEIAIRMGELSGSALLRQFRTLLGKDLESVEEMSQATDIVHAISGVEALWTMETKFKGCEMIYHCKVNNLAPAEFRGKGILKKWCVVVGEASYAKAQVSPPVKVTRFSFACEGDSVCKVEVEMKEE